MAFTATAAYAPRVRVPAPAYRTAPFGLFTVATVVDVTDPSERNGAEVTPDSYRRASTLVDGCTVATDRVKAFERPTEAVTADPVTLYAGWECGPVGVGIGKAAALTALLNGEERGLEHYLATGSSDNSEANVFPWSTVTVPYGAGTTEQATVAAFGAHETTVAGEYGGVGVVYMTPRALAVLSAAGAIIFQNGGWVTLTGHKVTVNPYLADTSTALSLMFTGAVTVRRSEVVQFGEPVTLDRSDNTLWFVAERTVTVIADYILDVTP